MKKKHPYTFYYEAPRIEWMEMTVEQGFVPSITTDDYVEEDGTW